MATTTHHSYLFGNYDTPLLISLYIYPHIRHTAPIKKISMGKWNIIIVGVVCRVWPYIQRIFQTENTLLHFLYLSLSRFALHIFLFFRISIAQMLTFVRRCLEPSFRVTSVVPFQIVISPWLSEISVSDIYIFLDKIYFKCYNIVTNNNFTYIEYTALWNNHWNHNAS